jgi:hypothetical protein
MAVFFIGGYLVVAISGVGLGGYTLVGMWWVGRIRRGAAIRRKRC